MSKDDNKIVHLHAARQVRALKIPDGMFGPSLMRLIEDGCILRTLAQDPTRQSFRRERLQTLLNREDL